MEASCICGDFVDDLKLHICSKIEKYMHCGLDHKLHSLQFELTRKLFSSNNHSSFAAQNGIHDLNKNVNFTYSNLQAHFRLYHSKYSIINEDHTCLYRYANELNGRSRHLIPYCIRTPVTSQVEAKLSCYGKKITFVELKQNDITAKQLMEWIAPIDLISDYQEYLISGTGGNESFCNCSQLDRSFGNRCQYFSALFKTTVDELFDATFNQEKTEDIRTLNQERDVTCYILLNCTTYTGFCLDWRQICDGRVDCLNSIDEEHCLEKEISECNEKTEYRCMSGHCIPRAFSFDLTPDCPEWDDEKKTFMIFKFDSDCKQWASADCEEHSCGLSLFSCGDGQCIDYIQKNSFIKSCANQRDALLIKHIYANHNNRLSDECWRLKICNIGLSCLYESPTVPKSNCRLAIENIAQFCLDLYYRTSLCSSVNDGLFFLEPTIFYPYVQWLYGSELYESVPKGGRNLIMPRMVCYNTSVYNIKPWNSYYPLQIIHGLNCYHLNAFDNALSIHIFNHVVHGISLLSMIQNIFSNYSNSVSYTTLYTCKIGLQISPHRLKDGLYDCHPNDEDEADSSQSCSWNLTNRIECLFTVDTPRTCLPRRLLYDGWQDCWNSFDELIPFECTYDYDCQFLRNYNFSLSFPVVYEELCNGNMLVLGKISTDDETDCDAWPCKTRAHRCNGIWNRQNGCDELNCTGLIPNYISQVIANCSIDEHYCPQYNKSTLGCLPLSKAGDGRIDCLFGMDERLTPGIRVTTFSADIANILRPENYGRCINSTSIVETRQLCDQKAECPLQDDELLCSWNLKMSCLNHEYRCKNGMCITLWRRCDRQIDCLPDGDDEWACDLSNTKTLDVYRPFTLIGFDIEPYEDQIQRLILQKTIVSNNNIPMKEKKNIDIKLNIISHCHRGIKLYSKDGDIKCICPPSYYGTQCQYQSERLSIIFRSEIPPSFDQNTIYHLIFFLFNHNYEVISFETILYMPSKQSTLKYLIYLIYSRQNNQSKNNNYFVQIEAYPVTSTKVNSLSLIWYYPIQFSFLPVNRLVLLLNLESTSSNKIFCQRFKCIHGQCMSYVNDREKIFCLCHQNWTGLTCNQSLIINPCKHLNCDTVYSKCIIHGNHAVCLCTLGRLGHNCRIPYDSCYGIHCKNGGHCVSLDERTLNKVCFCPIDYYGDLCQYKTALLTILIPQAIEFIPAMVTHFLHTHKRTPGVLSHRSTYFLQNIHPNTEIIIYDYQQQFLPSIIIVQAFIDLSSYYGFYYLLSLIDHNRTSLIKTLNFKHRCLHVSERLPNMIMNLSWIKRIKFYHIYFQDVRCFFDEIYICLVDRDQLIDCLLFNHEVMDCIDHNYCENGGRCLDNKRVDQIQFACVCPECHYGMFCQLTMTQYSLTLDSILGQEILTDVFFYQQKPFVKILLTFVILLFFIGINSNLFSLLTFSHIQIRSTGCGFYLLVLSIVSQISLIIFLSRFIYLLISQMTILTNRQFLNISCKLFDFLLQLSISLCDWLSACVACERTVRVLRGIHFDEALSFRMVKFVVPILLISLLLLSIHQVFSNELIPDPRSDERLWCVIKFPLPWLQTYNAMMNLFKIIVPFLINLISAVILLINLSKVKKKTGKITYANILKKQFMKHKDLILSPIAMIIFKLPMLIIILAIKCIKYRWQLYVTTLCYFLSFIPVTATFIIFVLPAASYIQIFIDKWKKLFKRV
ncbi:hypothetical protein I4U23_016634 [Adineta vaga]|nr:hypothetical protein I4U23_016634 [Adineta vaga]